MHVVRADLLPPVGIASPRSSNVTTIRTLVAYRWGLVPAWAKDVRIGSRFPALHNTVGVTR